MNYYAILKNKLDEKELPYSELKDGVLEINQKGKKNAPNIRLVIGFDDPESCRPWIKCYDLGHFEGDKYAAGLLACNNANKQYRWVRFYMDGDNDVVAAMDAIVSSETVFDEMIELIVRMLQIIDDLYPEFMRARWG